MSKIKYLTGDATEPQGSGIKIIAHICNDIGGWGAGFVMALSKKWESPERLYRKWSKSRISDLDFTLSFRLGATQFIKPDPHEGIYVANMIAQHDIRWYGDVPPIRYDRLRQCLNTVASKAKELNATVHIPDLIGCGLAGGHKPTVIGLIEETLLFSDIDVFAYTLPEITNE